MQQENINIDELVKRSLADDTSIDALLDSNTNSSLSPDFLEEINGAMIGDDPNKPCIMVVDDDDSQLKSITKLLQRHYRLLLCDRGKKALECLEKNIDLISAVLLDIRLPDIEGFDVFNSLKEINHDIPIIFITGYQQRYGDGYEIYRKYRPHGYIVKNHENETSMIRDTLASAVEIYEHIRKIENEKATDIRNQTIAGLLHDLKNVFMPLPFFVDIIDTNMKAQSYEQAEDFLIELKKAMEMFSSLQKILFNFAKGDKVKPDLQVHDLNQSIAKFIPVMEMQFADMVELVTDLHYDQPFVTDVTILFYQVLMNIIKNAAEAMSGRNGVVTLATYSFDRYRQTFGDKALFTNKAADDLVIVVSDNGPGLPPEMADKLLEPYATHGKSTGTGLGGWMIKIGIVDLLDGEIAIDNKPGQGLAYHIWLRATDGINPFE